MLNRRVEKSIDDDGDLRGWHSNLVARNSRCHVESEMQFRNRTFTGLFPILQTSQCRFLNLAIPSGHGIESLRVSQRLNIC